MKQTDDQLVKQVLEGNIDSFGDLVCKYQGVVYGLAYHMVYIQTVNDEDLTEKFGDTRIVDGELEILETGYGFARQGNTEAESIYVAPSQIRNFGLKTGDAIKGKARPPRQDVGEHYYALFYIHEVNGREPNEYD